MKKYDHLRNKAREWRCSGVALPEICKRLSLSKGTVFPWIKDIPIERTEKQTIAQKNGVAAMVEKYRVIRQDAYDKARKDAPNLLSDPLFRDFVLLYMTEGFRRTRNQVSVVNSNPAIVALANNWIVKLSKRKVSYSLQCHEDNDEGKLKKFWQDVLKTKEDIRVIRKSNSGELSGRVWRSVYGVAGVRTNDTEFRSRLQAWMEFIEEEWKRALA